jgi:hypothetical protein
MPLYLQALRGLSALQTGLMLLPLAITGGISVILPVLVMLALKERVWAAAWFGEGVAVIAAGSWRQIRELWWSRR